MATAARSKDLYKEIAKMPTIDAHAHLVRHKMSPDSIDDILLYHMVMYPLRSAGAREDYFWHWNDKERQRPSREAIIAEFAKAWPGMENTGFAQMLKGILRDLYEFDEPVTVRSLSKLDKAYEKKVSQPDWARQVMKRCNIVRVFSSQLKVPPLKKGEWDGNVRFTIESSPTDLVWEFKTLGDRLRGLEDKVGVKVRSIGDLEDAVAAYYKDFDWKDKGALVAWMGSVADFTPRPRKELDALIRTSMTSSTPSTPEQNGIFEAAVIRCMCGIARKKTGLFQLAYGTQGLTKGSGHHVARALPHFATTMGYLVKEFPDVHFNILNGYELDEPVLCALCTAYNNVSLSNFWWHAFYPTVMEHGWRRRLEMVPASRLVGFFSDGWCIDWIYARLTMVKKVLARVMSEKVEHGYYTTDEALKIAYRMLYETPKQIFLPNEDLDPRKVF